MPPPCLAEDLLVDYAAGRTDASLAAEVEAHLAGCPACRRVLEAVRELAHGADTVTHDLPPKPRGPAPPPLEVGEVLADRFELTACLGEGGMGVVYAAADRQLGVPVALKVLTAKYRRDPDGAQLLQNEIVVARRVTHRNVVRVYDFGVSGPHQFFTMEHVRGRSLSEALKAAKLPRHTAVRVFSELVAGLAAVHAEGIVHRDLKPGNVMLDEAGTARLMDFGLASADGSGSDGSRPRVGTPRYWAPEQARGEAPAPTADVFSAGVIGFQLLTGLGAQHASPAAARREVPRRFRAVIARCLDPDPAARPRDAAALSAAFERARRLPQRIALVVALALAVASVTAVAAAKLRAQSHAARAEAAIEQLMEGRTEQAGAELDRLVLDDVHSPEALLGMAMANWWREQPYANTAAACDEAIAAHQPPAREQFLEALKPLAQQRWAEALRLIEAPVPGAADEPLLAYGRFEALYHGGRPAEAVAAYRGLLAQRPAFRLGYDHVLDYAIATQDPEALADAATHADWLRDDLAYAGYAVRLALARGRLDEALALADHGAARSSEYAGGVAALRALHTRLLLVNGELAAAVEALRQTPAVTPPSTLDQLGFAVAVGDAARVRALTPVLDEEAARGLAPASEFRMRLDAWAMLALRADPTAAERFARAALPLSIPFRSGSMNLPLLAALVAGDDEGSVGMHDQRG